MTDITTAASAASSAASAAANLEVIQAAPAALSTPGVDLGFAHFISHTDAVGQGLFGILVIMSIISWGLILTRGVALVLRQRRSKAFLDFFWNATSLDAVQQVCKSPLRTSLRTPCMPRPTMRVMAPSACKRPGLPKTS